MSRLRKIQILIIRTQYLGHFCYEVAELLKEKHSDQNFGKVFCTTQPIISNRFLLKKLSREVPVLPRPIVVPIFLAGRLFGDTVVIRNYINAQKPLPPLTSIKPLLGFTHYEEAAGAKLNKSLEIDIMLPIVTFFIREETENSQSLPESNYRNNDIETYYESFLWLAEHFNVIRMGRNAKRPLGIDHPRIIDYATSHHQSDFADFHLAFQSSFAICTDSGSIYIPFLMGKRTFVCNCSLFSLCHNSPGELFLLKRHFHLETSNALGIEDLLQVGAEKISTDSGFEKLGIGLSGRTQSEILQFTKEVVSFMASDWNVSYQSLNAAKSLEKKLEWQQFVDRSTWFSNLNDF